MSDYNKEGRNRGRTLLIVEGNHEKNQLFWLIFQCFPEINIDMDDVWIYGTNIYMLYEDIIKEYGEEWADEEDDIDLPFVISKKQNPNHLCYKEDFTNIILVFDYERQDTNFSETRIMNMQKCFNDPADMGKLYINYPMIESYQHLKELPDSNYSERKIPVSMQPGKEYKELVRRESVISRIVEFPHRIEDLMKAHYGIANAEKRKECWNAALNISDEAVFDTSMQNILSDVEMAGRQKELQFQLKDWIKKLGYLHTNQSYWKYMRKLFQQIIYHNVCKANRIQGNGYEIELNSYKMCFERVDLVEILKAQNACSRDNEEGYIWVVNTCVFFVAEYNFRLVAE